MATISFRPYHSSLSSGSSSSKAHLPAHLTQSVRLADRSNSLCPPSARAADSNRVFRKLDPVAEKENISPPSLVTASHAPRTAADYALLFREKSGKPELTWPIDSATPKREWSTSPKIDYAEHPYGDTLVKHAGFVFLNQILSSRFSYLEEVDLFYCRRESFLSSSGQKKQLSQLVSAMKGFVDYFEMLSEDKVSEPTSLEKLDDLLIGGQRPSRREPCSKKLSEKEMIQLAAQQSLLLYEPGTHANKDPSTRDIEDIIVFASKFKKLKTQEMLQDQVDCLAKKIDSSNTKMINKMIDDDEKDNAILEAEEEEATFIHLLNLVSHEKVKVLFNDREPSETELASLVESGICDESDLKHLKNLFLDLVGSNYSVIRQRYLSDLAEIQAKIREIASK